jgi:hypothetical protein
VYEPTSPSAARQIARERAAFRAGKDDVTDEDLAEHMPHGERISTAHIPDPDTRARLTQAEAKRTGRAL